MKVVQCWDDGAATDIRLTELLRKYNAKATFNLCPGLFEEDTVMPYWLPYDSRTPAYRGYIPGRVGKKDLLKVYGDFEVASHCWIHETVGEVPDDEFINAAVEARKFLEDTFQKECPGFAWPCGVTSPETPSLLKEAGFRYGRTIASTDNVGAWEDPLLLNPSCHFLANDFWERYDNAKKTGIFYFWGHSYEMTEYSRFWEQMEAKLKYISEDPDAEWVNVIDLVK